MIKERTFRLVSIKERLPDFGERILFTNERYEGGYKSEYLPDEKIEIKRNKFIEMKDCPRVIESLKIGFTHWLEEINTEQLDLIVVKKTRDMLIDFLKKLNKSPLTQYMNYEDIVDDYEKGDL